MAEERGTVFLDLAESPGALSAHTETTIVIKRNHGPAVLAACTTETYDGEKRHVMHSVAIYHRKEYASHRLQARDCGEADAWVAAINRLLEDLRRAQDLERARAGAAGAGARGDRKEREDGAEA